MDFNLSHELQLLRDGLTKFLATRYDLEKSRSAAKTGVGWQPDIWRAFADELGLLGAALPEDVGGIGGGPVEVMVIAEAPGSRARHRALRRHRGGGRGPAARVGGDVATGLLENIVAGQAIVALAAAESTSGDHWQDAATTACRDGTDWQLDGAKIMAVGAPLATDLLVTAHTAGGLSLLGDEGRAWPSLERARDEGAAAVCAEAVGAMRKVLADTVEYCKQRHQFGRPIGSFQVLQHRMVDMHIELEQSVAATYLAVLNLEADAATRARAVSAAKATIGRAARFIGQNAVQLHGGMGMTEELAIGHDFKRLTAVQYEFCSTDYHVARYAELTRA
jgi:alkylation response protein AidB-like acyl-CoA dehydrogenase